MDASSPYDFERECFVLTRPGHDPLEFSADHFSVNAVSRAFSVDPSTVWLREEPPNNRAFFPDAQNRYFELPVDVRVGTHNFIVEGSEVRSIPSADRVSGTSSSSFVTPSLTTASRPPVLYSGSSRKISSSLNLKVVQANLKWSQNGKPDFLPQNQTFVDLTESTANVNYITTAIQRKWGEEYVLVTSDGLLIDDSSGTQGMKFWKVGSRKIYAVKSSALQVFSRNKRQRASAEFSSSDSEENSYHNKRSKFGSEISKITNELTLLRSDVRSLLDINGMMQLPVALVKLIKDAFFCHICHRTARPPIIYTKCCKYILGCQVCVDSWYLGEGTSSPRNCPRCRSERAYSDISRLNGFDELLSALKSQLRDPADSD